VPSVKEVYSIIRASASENFKVPSYESFMLDVSHRLNQRTIRLYAIKENEPASCIMTLSESKDSAVLGALATNPELRKRGYGAFLIKYINNVLVDEGKTVYLHRAPDENIAFYNKLGFSEYGKWAEYRE
ncbi:MAG: GNAT family N-acetyltransferase, partial [Ruminococcus sp.]|nr:GNAT family N-acetyltransferase [Ruminococcus sp.]